MFCITPNHNELKFLFKWNLKSDSDFSLPRHINNIAMYFNRLANSITFKYERK